MKKIHIINTFVYTALSVFILASCVNDLDRFPENQSTDKEVYSTFDGYKEAAGKVYAAYTLTGNQGPAGSPDIVGLDEGNYAGFLRGFFNLQELPTDEAMCIWNDNGIPGLNYINFSSENPFTRGFYNRCVMIVMYANDFIKNSTADVVAGKGFAGDQTTQINYLNAEARFLRAFAYWVLMDVYGNPPFVDENSPLDVLPQQISRADLFKYVEKELLEVEILLAEPRQNEYGRADKAAAWALLARLYLNANVYTGQARYTEAIKYAQQVIDSGYSLKETYEYLFLADNNINNNEVIFSINYDGIHTKSYSGMTFLINCAFNSGVQNDYNLNYGITTNAGWGGVRARKGLTERFDKENDTRFLFVGETEDIDNVSDFRQGLATYKYRNITSTGTNGSDSEHADNDFPLFRLAEMYLIYAEAVKRGGTGGSDANALEYMNRLRERAFGSDVYNYSNFGNVSMDEILNERSRELFWECHRRTDLIRFNMFTTSDYLWAWKGAVKEGRPVAGKFNLYPIPSSDIMANPNLKQNPNY